MTDHRDDPLHDPSRDDLSVLRDAPPARPRRRDRWSPRPTTEAGRRRARKARWITAGLVALGVALFVVRMAERAARERQARDAAWEPFAALGVGSTDVLRLVVVEARDDAAGHALTFRVQAGPASNAAATLDDPPIVLRLPAGDAEVGEVARRLVDALGSSSDPVLWLPVGLTARADLAALKRVKAAAATVGVHPLGVGAPPGSSDGR